MTSNILQFQDCPLDNSFSLFEPFLTWILGFHYRRSDFMRKVLLFLIDFIYPIVQSGDWVNFVLLLCI